ncbi:MAG: response regulator transcription factor [Ferruginibacter sp.]
MKILIVDDHDVIRQSLELIVRSEFPSASCTKLDNALSCIDLVKQEKFDLLILDMNLPDMNGINLTEWIMQYNPEQKILIFSMNPTGVFAKKLYQVGVMGYLNKQAPLSEVVKALQIILTEKKQYMNEEFKEILAYDVLNRNPSNPMEKLSKRELSIAQLLADGKTFDEIAGLLNIEASTIRTYKGRIFQKLDVNTLHEFLAKAQLYKIN